MFTLNKYTRWYYQIIDNAKLRQSIDYVESHHIIPKCMGGRDTKDNRVDLTAREHALCHWLLTKMTTGADRGKMFYALKALCMASKHQPRTSKIPTKVIAREQAAAYSSLVQKGRPRSKESIEKQRATMTGRTRDPSYGQKMSEILTGRKHSPEHIENNRKAQTGKVMSDATRAKMSAVQIGRPVSEATREKIIGTKHSAKI